MYVSCWLLCCHEPKYLQVSVHQALSGPDQDDNFGPYLIHCSGRWQLRWAAVPTITRAQRTLVGRRTKKQVKMCSARWRPRLEGRYCRSIAMHDSSYGRSHYLCPEEDGSQCCRRGAHVAATCYYLLW